MNAKLGNVLNMGTIERQKRHEGKILVQENSTRSP